MTVSIGARLAGDSRGAVAPTVALSLFALIAAGGIAFDYARLAAMDTELQNAADQAALAAASQLDGRPGACARAAAAANSLLTNRTVFANETTAGTTTAIVVPTGTVTSCAGNANIAFYQTYNSVTDTPGLAATDPANARFVSIQVNPREAFYALTPVVAAVRSGPVGAAAVATLGTAICKTPPVMMCNPEETGLNSDFDTSAYIGAGLKLVSVGNSGGAWVPGNFGYLDSNGGSNGASGLRESLGWTNPPGECQAVTGVDTKPGASVSVTDAINTRFDIYDSNNSCPSGGSCPASINSVKDVVRDVAASGGNACKLHNQGWHEVASAGQYLPTDPANYLPTTTTPTAMGHPRDICHAVSSGGSCAKGVIGDKKWDRDAYFRANYARPDGTRWSHADWRANTGLGVNATRYEVYSWEIGNRGKTVDGVTVLGSHTAAGSDTAYGQPQCSAGQGFGGGTVPTATTIDRRRVSIAVVNCQSNNVRGNSTDVPVLKWIDGFLVEPSVNRSRTHQGDVYIEVISELWPNGGGAPAQLVRRDMPQLIR